MSAKTYWKLLVFSCVLCQGIIGTLSEKDYDESSELLLRQKRVINRLPGEDKREKIKNVPYVVAVKAPRTIGSCAGVILTNRIVLTAAKCVENERVKYKVYSGNAQAIVPGYSGPTVHKVTNKQIRNYDQMLRIEDGIALLTVNPPFTYSINTHNIELYEGPVHAGLLGMVSGWGCNPRGDPGTEHPTFLRTITVPIISNDHCRMLYPHTSPITESDVCTLDAGGHQYCGLDDGGAPLVIQVDYRKYLLGIHLWNGRNTERVNPDVFVNLQIPRFKRWILETIPIMETIARQLQPSNIH